MELSKLIDIPIASFNNYNQVRAITCVAFHPSAPIMVIASNTEQSHLELWHFSEDGSNMRLVSTLIGHTKWINSVVFHPVLPILASCSKDNTAILWRLSHDNLSATIATVIKINNRSIHSIVFHPTMPLFVSSSGNERSGSIKLWSFSDDGSSTNFLQIVEKTNTYFKCVEFHKTLPILVTSNYNSTKLWRLNTDNSSFTCIDRNLVGEINIDALAFHPILPLIAIASVVYNPSSQAYVKLYQFSEDGSDTTLVNTIVMSSMVYRANSLAFHPTKPVIAIGCFKGDTQLWVLSSDNKSAALISNVIETVRYYQERITTVAFHKTLPLLAISCAIDKVNLVNIENLNRKLRWANPTQKLKEYKELVLTGLSNDAYSTGYNRATSLSPEQMRQALTRQLPSRMAGPIPEHLKDADSYDRFIAEQIEQKRKEEGKGLLDEYDKYLDERKQSNGGRITNNHKKSKTKYKKSFNNKRKSRKYRNLSND